LVRDEFSRYLSVSEKTFSDGIVPTVSSATHAWFNVKGMESFLSWGWCIVNLGQNAA